MLRLILRYSERSAGSRFRIRLPLRSKSLNRLRTSKAGHRRPHIRKSRRRGIPYMRSTGTVRNNHIDGILSTPKGKASSGFSQHEATARTYKTNRKNPRRCGDFSCSILFSVSGCAPLHILPRLQDSRNPARIRRKDAPVCRPQYGYSRAPDIFHAA